MSLLGFHNEKKQVTLSWGVLGERYRAAAFEVTKVDADWKCKPKHILRWKTPHAVKVSEDFIRIGSVVGTSATEIGRLCDADNPKGRSILGYVDIDPVQVFSGDGWDNIAVGSELDCLVIDRDFTRAIPHKLRKTYVRKCSGRLERIFRATSSLSFYNVTRQDEALEQLAAIKDYAVMHYGFDAKNIENVFELPII